MRTSAGLFFYRAATSALSPLARPFLHWRARQGKEVPSRLQERLGRATRPRPPGPLVWLHGASIGEGLSLLPLIEALRARGLAALLTTGTPGSAQLLGARLPVSALHQFVPLDTPRAVRTFLDHWRPQLLMLAESELWPNMILGCARRAIPVTIVNGRLSQRSYDRWHRVTKTASALLGRLAVCIVQSQEQAARWRTLGARNVVVAGNLKFDGAVPPADPHELARLNAAVGGRPVLVAASLHADEDAIVLVAFARARTSAPDLLLILVPRDVTRGAALCDLARHAGLAAVQRSRGGRIARDTDVLVADTIGEMGLWLRLASCVVIGKTFGDGGGQTPLEAARCGAPILHGPSTTAFADAFAALDAAGGARVVSAETLGDAVSALLDNPAEAREMARAATRVVVTMGGATERTLAALATLLPSPEETPAP